MPGNLGGDEVFVECMLEPNALNEAMTKTQRGS